MKNIVLTIAEFLQFKELANKLQIAFDYSKVKNGQVTVTAKTTDLEFIGY